MKFVWTLRNSALVVVRSYNRSFKFIGWFCLGEWIPFTRKQIFYNLRFLVWWIAFKGWEKWLPESYILLVICTHVLTNNKTISILWFKRFLKVKSSKRVNKIKLFKGPQIWLKHHYILLTNKNAIIQSWNGSMSK